MKLAHLGRYVKTNSVIKDKDYITKRFRRILRFYPTMLWGNRERKPYRSPVERYMRDSRTAMRLFEYGINVPQVIDFSDKDLWFSFTRLDTGEQKMNDLISVFEDPKLTFAEKLQYYREALELLLAIHESGETHGDPYLKNFFRMPRNYPGRNGRVYTCDFEFARASPVPEVTDIMILTGDSIDILRGIHHDEYVTFSILDILSEVYGELPPYPFDKRDQDFLKVRFHADQRFFDYFA